MNATGPPQYKRLQVLRTVLGLENSHAETSGIQCVQDPVRIGAVSYAVGAEEHEIARRDDGDPAAVDQSSASSSRMADGSEGDYGQGQVFPLLNELSERVDALESSMREQKQWNQDIEETVDQIHRSLAAAPKVVQRAARPPTLDDENIRRRWRDGEPTPGLRPGTPP